MGTAVRAAGVDDRRAPSVLRPAPFADDRPDAVRGLCPDVPTFSASTGTHRWFRGLAEETERRLGSARHARGRRQPAPLGGSRTRTSASLRAPGSAPGTASLEAD